jgi:hypothetical protein
MNKLNAGLIFLTTISLISMAQAKSAEPAHCLAVITENGVKEKHSFKFRCDNYGQDATFESKSGRYTVIAFSEESCTPQLMVHDSTTNTLSTAVGMTERIQAGFEIFKDRLVLLGVVGDVKKEDLMGAPNKTLNKIVVGCSTNKDLLADLNEED